MNNTDKLKQLCLLPPPTDAPWAGAVEQSIKTYVAKEDGSSVELKVPLFWYSPQWHDFSVGVANQVAFRATQWSFPVTALRSELSGPESQSAIHTATSNEDGDGSSSPLRIVPYRPERYGLSPEDFDDAAVIDVRLSLARDATGRFAYSPAQLQRWEATPPDQPLAGGGWVPAATFPPDVDSFEQLASKLRQLRSLSPSAAVFLSINPFRLAEELPKALSSKPDGIILVMNDTELEGLQLAALTHRTRRLMELSGAADMPLWIVPGAVTADDAVKLVALGASAVAIDGWTDEIYRRLSQSNRNESAAPSEMEIIDAVDDSIGDYVDRFIGLYLSLQRVDPEGRLGSFSASWAKALGVLPLG